MLGISAIGAVVLAYDVFAIRKQKETISSACRRIQKTKRHRALFLLAWAALGKHLLARQHVAIP